MTTVRRALLGFLAAAALLLSFDALRSRALESGLIPAHAILPAGWLAALWALVIDVAAAAGILGVRGDRRDRRAWAMLLLAFGASVVFQIRTPPTAVARAVPPSWSWSCRGPARTHRNAMTRSQRVPSPPGVARLPRRWLPWPARGIRR